MIFKKVKIGSKVRLNADKPYPLACGKVGDIAVVIDKTTEEITLSILRDDNAIRQWICSKDVESSNYSLVSPTTRTSAHRQGVPEWNG